MTRQRYAWLLVAIGAAAAVGGVALVYPPAAVIIAGLAIAAFGLFVIEVGEKK